jgi:TRAP-type C4-dicarboxylate transport system permease large subunit
MTPGIIIGGKIFGWFTATESACIAVLYAGVLSLFVYREMDMKGLYSALLDTGKLRRHRAVLRRHRERFGWLLAYYKIRSDPDRRRRLGHGLHGDRLLHRLRVPGGRLLPRRHPGDHHLRADPRAVAKAVQMDPVHFAMIGIVSLAFGLVTPPYGLCLMISCAVRGIRIRDAIKDTGIMLIPMLMMLALVIMCRRFRCSCPT